MTMMMTPEATSEAFWATAIDEEHGGFLSFDRCVDWLLSLHEMTDDTQLQGLVEDVLEDLRELGPIEDGFEDLILGALASVETAFEIKALGRSEWEKAS